MNTLGKRDFLGRKLIGFVDGKRIYETKEYNTLEVIRTICSVLVLVMQSILLILYLGIL